MEMGEIGGNFSQELVLPRLYNQVTSPWLHRVLRKDED